MAAEGEDDARVELTLRTFPSALPRVLQVRIGLAFAAALGLVSQVLLDRPELVAWTAAAWAALVVAHGVETRSVERWFLIPVIDLTVLTLAIVTAHQTFLAAAFVTAVVGAEAIDLLTRVSGRKRFRTTLSLGDRDLTWRHLGPRDWDTPTYTLPLEACRPSVIAGGGLAFLELREGVRVPFDPAQLAHAEPFAALVRGLANDRRDATGEADPVVVSRALRPFALRPYFSSRAWLWLGGALLVLVPSATWVYGLNAVCPVGIFAAVLVLPWLMRVRARHDPYTLADPDDPLRPVPWSGGDRLG